jgi:hypothetical protein
MNKAWLCVAAFTFIAFNTYGDPPIYLADNFDGHGYELIPTPTPWHIAKKKADQNGGYLVVITSPEENEFIMELIKKATKGGTCQAWLGLSDEKKEGDWRWINSEKVSFNYWSAGQPDNYNNAENFACFVTRTDGLRWNDHSGDARTANIVEYDHEITSDTSTETSGPARPKIRSTR